MTNKIVLREIDQLMADYVPQYPSFMPLFLGKSQSYAEQVGQLTFKRLEAVGDIRAHVLTPKDTEMRQISVKESSKVFKKYFLANQFVQSALQDSERIEDVVKQVLDEHQKQMDELFLLGAGTSASNVINNGLYWSGDSNYALESSTELASTDGHLPALHASIVEEKAKADRMTGEKVVIYYGSTMLQKYNALYPDTQKPFKVAMGEVLGAGYRQVELPADITPSNANGFIIANLGQVKLHYTSLPSLKAQGVNEEKMYVWHNFVMGSCMLECLAPNAIIRQPHTFA
jgi:hypothetical protein